jgi:hypothetical protein
MSRRDEWRRVLDREVERWSARPCEELPAGQVYAMISVDDGRLPASVSPLTRSFIRPKPDAAP